MPLRDHFRPPLDEESSWEGFHGGWPMMIVADLVKRLPPRHVAAPRVHFGAARTDGRAGARMNTEQERNPCSGFAIRANNARKVALGLDSLSACQGQVFNEPDRSPASTVQE